MWFRQEAAGPVSVAPGAVPERAALPLMRRPRALVACPPALAVRLMSETRGRLDSWQAIRGPMWFRQARHRQ
jgi:hypothetical protein